MGNLVSIIVPVYNTDHGLLKKCIQSITGQTYPNLEIIIVDDGSDTCTALNCDFLSREDKRISVIHKSNGGLSSARNAGLDVANGEYLAFIDSDDFIHRDAIKNLVECQKTSDCPIVCMGSIIIDEEGNSLHRFGNDTMDYSTISAPDYIKGICTKTKSESVCDKLFKHELLKNRRFEYGRLNEDFFFLSKLLMENSPDIAILDFAGYNYLKHNGTITSDCSNFNSLKDAISNSKELTYMSEKVCPECTPFFAYSTLFQSRVLFANISISEIIKGSDNWLFVKNNVKDFSSYINKCELSFFNRVILRGILWAPYPTKLLYKMIK